VGKSSLQTRRTIYPLGEDLGRTSSRKRNSMNNLLTSKKGSSSVHGIFRERGGKERGNGCPGPKKRRDNFVPIKTLKKWEIRRINSGGGKTGLKAKGWSREKCGTSGVKNRSEEAGSGDDPGKPLKHRAPAYKKDESVWKRNAVDPKEKNTGIKKKAHEQWGPR